MTVKERILAIRLAERLWQNPEYAKQIGVSAEIREINGKGKHQEVTKRDSKAS